MTNRDVSWLMPLKSVSLMAVILLPDSDLRNRKGRGRKREKEGGERERKRGEEKVSN